MIRVKICGVTRPEDAAHAVEVGADFLGLNCWPPSKRYLPPVRAPEVAAAARAAGSVRLVGVFVNQPVAEIAAIARAVSLDILQLHGDETPGDIAQVAAATGLPVWRALGVAGPTDLAGLEAWPVEALLLDAPSAGRGGAGKVFDWALAHEARRLYPDRRFVLAGGLGPHNVAAAIAAVGPWAVDVASGVESAPGIKDPTKVAGFVAAARFRTIGTPP
ncbi:MAG TPA: phosphoribosylanthranilate isomerase [Kofleriaceae bacterium]|nr:phosphoribosylanthranilate isomerase [Kofleriaceae bacterium]